MRGLLGLVGLSLVAPAAAQERVWSGENVGYARQIAVAANATTVFIAEAYSVTSVDRASGAQSVIRVEPYAPVERACYGADRLWIAHGIPGRSGDGPRISTLTPGARRLTLAERTHSIACGLTVEGSELFWWDRNGEHVHHRAVAGGRVRALAPAPSGYRYDGECRGPIAIAPDAIYMMASPLAAAYRAHVLVRVPRDGGSAEVLMRGLRASALLAVTPSGELWIGEGPGPDGPGSVARWDAAARARSPVAELSSSLEAFAVHDGFVLWATGRFYSQEPYEIWRAPLGGGAPARLHRGDVRMVAALLPARGELMLLLHGHPEGECSERYEGCGQMGQMRRVCTAPDHQLLRFSWP